MIKEEKPVFKRILLVIGIMFLANIGIFLYNLKNASSGFTGFSIGETVSQTYSTVPFIAKIFLLVQWVFLIAILIFSLIKDKGVESRKQELSGIDLERISKKGTDLDILYSLLQKKQQLRISTISKIFKINKDVAMDWCKTLESGNLAIIDYPGIGEPVVNLVGQ